MSKKRIRIIKIIFKKTKKIKKKHKSYSGD